MEVIIPEFENQEEKNKIMLFTLLSIVPFIPIFVYFFGTKFSDGPAKILKALVNFEIIILIAGFVVYNVPIIGYLAGNIVPIVNLIVLLMAIASINNNTEIKIPVFFKFVQ